MKLGVIGGLVLLSAGMLPPQATACTCAAARQPCSAFWAAAAVFAGRVESISAGDPADVFQRRTVRFKVIEGFRGAEGSDLTILAVDGFCRVDFKPGRDYLVYADREDGTRKLTVSVCSRTQPLERAGLDLAYARAATGPGTPAGRVSGSIRRFEQTVSPLRGAAPVISVIAGTAGTEAARAVVDSQGRFTIEGLPAGRYALSLDMPDAYYGQLWPNPVDVADARGCVEVEGLVGFNGRLASRVVDRSGRPVVGLTVELVRAEAAGRAATANAVTGEDGRFQMSHVPPGTFVLGINMHENEDLPRVFYPGVERAVDARRVKLAGGQSMTLGDFALPAHAQYVRVTGVVLDANGSTVAGARVFLKGASDIDYVLGEPVTTDPRGYFEIATFAGVRYRLFAERSRPEGHARVDSSEAIPFVAASTMAPVQLRLKRNN